MRADHSTRYSVGDSLDPEDGPHSEAKSWDEGDCGWGPYFMGWRAHWDLKYDPQERDLSPYWNCHLVTYLDGQCQEGLTEVNHVSLT